MGKVRICIVFVPWFTTKHAMYAKLELTVCDSVVQQ